MSQSFTQQHRLKKADDFSSVFLFRKSRTGIFLKIYFKPNQLDNSRLGLIVSKRVHKRANKRNYMKRLLRELFRTNQADWTMHYDIVIKVIKLYTHDNFLDINAEFLQLTKSFYTIKSISTNINSNQKINAN